MRKRLTQKQETFCLKYFELRNATEAALLAGYSPKYAANNTPKLLNNTKIQKRIDELGEEIERAAVMNVQERMERLTEIGRARLTDFMTAGADGSWVDIGPENPHSGALQEITSRTEYDDKSAGAAVITRIKLHDPTKAIDLLNKMDKIYSDGAQFIDNRKIEIYDAKGKLTSIITRLASRIGEGKSSQLTDGR